MLAFTRFSGQGFWIGDDVHVRVLKLPSGKIRVAVQAPREIKILREELTDRPRPVPKERAER